MLLYVEATTLVFHGSNPLSFRSFSLLYYYYFFFFLAFWSNVYTIRVSFFFFLSFPL